MIFSQKKAIQKDKKVSFPGPFFGKAQSGYEIVTGWPGSCVMESKNESRGHKV